MFLHNNIITPEVPLRAAITLAYRWAETNCAENLLNYLTLSPEAIDRIQMTARKLVEAVRNKRLNTGGIDAFMYQYNLSSEEGIALMCLAEALLRIPDAQTRDKLIQDKLATVDWQSHVGQSHSLFVNAATWGLMLTGKIYQWDELKEKNLLSALKKLTARSGEPFIRLSVAYAMKIMGKQYVMGRTIKEAMKRATHAEARGYSYSYDMLGEAARTAEDAERYLLSYENAIHAIGKAAKQQGPEKGPGISVKLSAIYPRYEYAKQAEVMAILVPRLLHLALLAKHYQLGFTVDAEEAERLDLSLDVMEAVLSDPQLQGWDGFGLALQAYQKRAFFVIDWLADLAKRSGHRIMLRLVKGAYWDAEIKTTQEKGLSDYPVFTRKITTDVSYLACAQKIISYGEVFYPQFATHNAYTVAVIKEMMQQKKRPFEFQCLHGMGQTLYDEIVADKEWPIPCRIYAPVGSHEDLLAYLVRRLLENGANSSFVNRIVDANEPIENLIQDPVKVLRELEFKPHPRIPLPRDLYGTERKNAEGIDMTDPLSLQLLQQELTAAMQQTWKGGVILNGKLLAGNEPIYDPSLNSRQVGTVSTATPEQIETALASAQKAAAVWDKTPVAQRAACLERAADLLEARKSFFMALAIREAGKTLSDAISEIREAVDFCRYYAVQAKKLLSEPLSLPGPTGEINWLELHGRGVVVSISPWNFPLAIFMGQISAALVTGNSVIAKPAEQTPLIASYAVQLLHEAGIPPEVLHLLPGPGEVVGAALIADLRTQAVMFTGSTDTARLINQTLAHRAGPIVPLIAETGGQNAMIVDSSALPEQVVADVLLSAFGSAGQRCSALRVLFLQEDIADKVITMLKGAMQELTVGDPALLATDIGPVIDKDALTMLQQHLVEMQAELIYQTPVDPLCSQAGTYFAPCMVEIDSLDRLQKEFFGPFLHVIRYKAEELDKVIAMINQSGYGLTMGIHSRIEATVNYIRTHVHIGNTYVNRGMTGAVVGVQPFGGEGLSGTGPKAGGPHYLTRLCVERTVTINTTAAGGNASLMSL